MMVVDTKLVRPCDASSVGEPWHTFLGILVGAFDDLRWTLFVSSVPYRTIYREIGSDAAILERQLLAGSGLA